MKKLKYTIACFCLLNLCSLILAQDNGYIKLTKSYMGALKRNEAYKNKMYYDTNVYGKMAAYRAEKTVEDFIKEKGPIVAIERTEADTQGCKVATATAIKTNKGKFLFYHFYDQGQHLQRIEIDTFDMQWFYKPENPIKNHTEKEVLIETNLYIKLPGTLYLPKNVKKAPVAVIVHGSGPQDRNCTVGKNKIYRDIALGLVEKGIAVLVYDKRTYVYQFNNPFPLDSMDYYQETIEDAVAAIQLVKKQTEVDSTKVFLMGHSQGAMCAPKIAELVNQRLKGVVLMAGPARTLLEIIPEQIEYMANLDGKVSKEEETQLNGIKWQVKNAQSDKLTLNTKKGTLPFNAGPKYWLCDRNLKQVETAKTLKLPVLNVQGGRDYNVTLKEFRLWEAAMAGKSNYQSQVFDDLDHLYFKGVGMAKPEDISKAQHVDKRVIERIASFIGK
jgi:dienelactone hydrolase